MQSYNYIPGLEEFPLTAFPVVNHSPWKLHRHGDHAELVVVTGGKGKHLLEAESFVYRSRHRVVVLHNVA